MSSILENAIDLGQGVYTQAEVDSRDTAPLLDKYADILLERENKRLTINQLEANI